MVRATFTDARSLLNFDFLRNSVPRSFAKVRIGIPDRRCYYRCCSAAFSPRKCNHKDSETAGCLC